jgi:hypothetical protein
MMSQQFCSQKGFILPQAGAKHPALHPLNFKSTAMLLAKQDLQVLLQLCFKRQLQLEQFVLLLHHPLRVS